MRLIRADPAIACACTVPVSTNAVSSSKHFPVPPISGLYVISSACLQGTSTTSPGRVHCLCVIHSFNTHAPTHHTYTHLHRSSAPLSRAAFEIRSVISITRREEVHNPGLSERDHMPIISMHTRGAALSLADGETRPVISARSEEL